MQCIWEHSHPEAKESCSSERRISSPRPSLDSASWNALTLDENRNIMYLLGHLISIPSYNLAILYFVSLVGDDALSLKLSVARS